MNTKITTLQKLALTALFLFFAQLTYAANYYAYKNQTVTINTATTFAEYRWIFVSKADGTTNEVITGQTTATLTQTFTVEGLYKLRVQVRNTEGCWSDIDTSTDIDIFVLPDFTVTVAADAGSSTTYCTNVGAADRTKLLATATTIGSVTLPSEVTFVLADWYKTASSAGDIASITPSATNTNPYLLTETAVGTHYFVATGKYSIPAGRLISAAAAPVKSTATTITINPAPTTPTITPTVTN
ncbi:hypothetical protein [Pedobacter ureilyticus]|jgi:hypothetical protein|uniref:PKD domain-containing protein n=1 Tax=Pedobacter ureilyticus TaxID=1393051 RepID=A0ABW9JC37_9SPHI|nr:hypothetical protein [Pedobacter helvus]